MTRRRVQQGPVVAASVLLVLALTLFLVWALRFARDSRERSSEGSKTSLAVMFFENASDQTDADQLALMLTGLLTAELSRAPELDVVSLERLYDVTRDLGGGSELVDRSRAAEVAERLALDTMLIGQVARTDNGALTAEVDVVDVGEGRLLARREAEGDELGDIFAVAGSLAGQLRRVLDATAGPTGSEVSRTDGLTDSVDAYRAYASGEDLLHRKEYRRAYERFREATRLDPEFALAYYRLGIAAGWLSDPDEALAATERALELADPLPDSLRDLFLVATYYRKGRYSEAIPLVESLLADDPENKEALYFLAEMYLHSGLDTHVRKATEAMVLLHTLDPEFGLMRSHLFFALGMLGQGRQARAQLEEWRTDQPYMVEELGYFLSAFTHQLHEVPEFREPHTGGYASAPVLRGSLCILTERWDQARTILDDMSSEGSARSWQLRLRGNLHAYLGELETALVEYREAASIQRPPGQQGVSNGVPGAAYVAMAELLILRGDLAGARQAAEEAVRLQPQNPGPHYHAGRLALLDGDRQAAEEHLKVTRRASATSRGTLAPLYHEALEAELLLAEGQAEEARRRYEAVVGSGALLHDFMTSYSSSGTAFRAGLARACRGLWDQDCEIAALQGLVESGLERLDHPVPYVRALFRLGELFLEAGDDARARDYFERFLEHWDEADRTLAEVAEARELLAR